MIRISICVFHTYFFFVNALQYTTHIVIYIYMIYMYVYNIFAINIYIGPHLHPIASNVGWIFWTIRYIRSVSDIFGGKTRASCWVKSCEKTWAN